MDRAHAAGGTSVVGR